MCGFVGVLQDAMRGTSLVSPPGVGVNAQGSSSSSAGAVHSMVSPSNRHQFSSQLNGSTRPAVHAPNHWISQPGKARLSLPCMVSHLSLSMCHHFPSTHLVLMTGTGMHPGTTMQLVRKISCVPEFFCNTCSQMSVPYPIS